MSKWKENEVRGAFREQEYREFLLLATKKLIRRSFHQINLETQHEPARAHTKTIAFYVARMLNERILSLAAYAYACQQ